MAMSDRDREIWTKLFNTPPSQLPGASGQPATGAATPPQPPQPPQNRYGYSGIANPNSSQWVGPNDGTYKDPAYGYQDKSGYDQYTWPSAMELNRTFGRGFATSARTGVMASPQGQEDMDLAAQFANDPRGYEAAVARRNIFQQAGWGAEADPTRYMLGGNPEWAGNRVAQFDAKAAEMSGPSRYQPAVDGSILGQGSMAGRMGGVGDQIGGVANQFGGVAGQIGQAANGAGYQGQLNAAGGLYALGQQGQGPSAAEMAMRAQAGQALQGQAAMAAAGRGANAGLAMQNASGANATIQGNLIAQLGQQRAAEDLAYRQQRMQALGAAGGMYGNAMGSQVSALGQQANALGGQGQMLGQQAGVYGASAGAMNAAGNTALAGAQSDLMRDEASRAYAGMATDVAKTDLGANISYDAARTGNFMQIYGYDRAGLDAKAARDDAFEKSLIGGGVNALGNAAYGFFGSGGRK